MYVLFYLVWVMITLILFFIFQVAACCLILGSGTLHREEVHQTNPAASISTEMATIPCIGQKR
jgi:hypothetical protein